MDEYAEPANAHVARLGAALEWQQMEAGLIEAQYEEKAEANPAHTEIQTQTDTHTHRKRERDRATPRRGDESPLCFGR